MTTDVAALDFDGFLLRWLCPGCKRRHGATLTGNYTWEWNGSLERPTLAPSFLTNLIQNPDNPVWNATHPRCHSFMRDGRLEFLGDCEHDLAGQTVDMVEWIPRPGDTP